MVKFLKYWLPVIVWMGVIFYFSNQPGLVVTDGREDFFLRKFAHVGEYAVLYILILRGLVYGRNLEREVLLRLSLLSFLASFLYSVLDETHQYFVPLRDGRLSDVLIDSLGIASAFTLTLKKRASVF